MSCPVVRSLNAPNMVDYIFFIMNPYFSFLHITMAPLHQILQLQLTFNLKIHKHQPQTHLHICPLPTDPPPTSSSTPISFYPLTHDK